MDQTERSKVLNAMGVPTLLARIALCVHECNIAVIGDTVTVDVTANLTLTVAVTVINKPSFIRTFRDGIKAVISSSEGSKMFNACKTCESVRMCFLIRIYLSV